VIQSRVLGGGGPPALYLFNPTDQTREPHR
jgi:hypothetical protein